MIDPNTLLAIALLPLAAAVLAGLFGRLIGRTAAHVVTIAAVGASFLLSALVAWQLLVQGDDVGVSKSGSEDERERKEDHVLLLGRQKLESRE
jgi:hypothetical protein